MAAEKPSYEGLMHAGAASGLVLVQLSAIIPGLLPSLVIAGLLAAVFVVPLLLLGLLATVLFLPIFGLWRLATHAARRRSDKVAARARARSPLDLITH
jgi:fatty acid desaturase